MNICC